MKENVIEWIRGDDVAKVTAPSGSKLKGTIVRLAQKHTDKVHIIEENQDGSIFAEVPVGFVKIRAPKQMSDSQREAARERMKKIVENRKNALEN